MGGFERNLMTKLLVPVLTLVLMSPTFAARPCKVYGISDSPQKLACIFPGRKVLLTCHDGKYLLNQTQVSAAFHMEVESGTVPLVFKTTDTTMTVLMDDPIEAELEMDKTEVRGSCQR